MPSKPKLLKSVGALFNDLEQLKNAYPNANKFFGALANNIKAVAPPNPMDTQASQEYAMNRAFDAPMLGAIKVYHGSPHKFDKFDMGKIGTGEGAQVYGHGLYFAENPSVAQSYADNVQLPKSFPVDDYKKIVQYKRQQRLGNKLTPEDKASLDELNIRKQAYEDAVNTQNNIYDVSLQWPDAAREATDPLTPSHFVDFDKPIGEQAQYIKDLIPGRPTQNPIKAIHQAFSEGDSWAMEWAKQQGLNPYSAEFGALTADELATMYLKSKGIPGTKYLDQGSRGAGGGTYNYVVFDDKIPKIISVNGEPIFLK